MPDPILNCPKCGYKRQSSDRCPDYECPKCGVIYQKYLQSNRQREAFLSTSPGELAAVSEVVGTFVTKSTIRKKVLLSFLGVAVLTLMALFAVVQFTEYGSLRFRYARYIDLNRNLNHRDAYPYLSKQTRNQISEDAWTFHWEIANDMRQAENFKSVNFNTNKESARIVSVISIQGEQATTNYQTWIKEDGYWNRAFVEDQPSRGDSISAEYSEKLNQKSSFKVVSMTTSWGVNNSEIGAVSATPQTTLVIKNDGTVPITHLMLKIDYIDKLDSVVMSSVESGNVAGDTPIPINAQSKNVYLNSNASFIIKLDALNSLEAERIASQVVRRIYSKRQSDERWQPVSVENLENK